MKKHKGFTLIELLVVIVIIGVLTSLIMANFVGIRQRARDGQRKADMRIIQQALELYRSDSASYPSTGSFSCSTATNSIKSPDGNSTYLQTVPCDPLDGINYAYGAPNGSTYTLVACLENGKDDQLDKDAGGNPIPCTGAASRWQLTYRNP